jgi:hypothetical protein
MIVAGGACPRAGVLASVEMRNSTSRSDQHAATSLPSAATFAHGPGGKALFAIVSSRRCTALSGCRSVGAEDSPPEVQLAVACQRGTGSDTRRAEAACQCVVSPAGTTATGGVADSASLAAASWCMARSDTGTVTCHRDLQVRSLALSGRLTSLRSGLLFGQKAALAM